MTIDCVDGSHFGFVDSCLFDSVLRRVRSYDSHSFVVQCYRNRHMAFPETTLPLFWCGGSRWALLGLSRWRRFVLAAFTCALEEIRERGYCRGHPVNRNCGTDRRNNPNPCCTSRCCDQGFVSSCSGPISFLESVVAPLYASSFSNIWKVP